MSTVHIKKGKTILSSIKEEMDCTGIYGVIYSGKIYRLDTIAEQEFVAEVLKIDDPDGYRIYYSTIIALFIAAARRLYPDIKMRSEYFIGDAFYLTPKGDDFLRWNQIQLIKKQMDSYIENDIKLLRKRLKKEEALEIFKNENQYELLRLYKDLDIEKVDLIEIDNMHFVFHNYLAPTAAFGKHYEIKAYYPGILLLFQKRDGSLEIEKFIEQKNLAKTYYKSKKELSRLEISGIADINERILEGRARSLIHKIDLQLEDRLRNLAKSIVEDEEIRMILVAGPSSSGKTTFSKKLTSHLASMGKFAVNVSMDDYFVDREKNPIDTDGKYNFESEKAVNIDRFNEDMLRLLLGRKVQLPRFDFHEGKSLDDGRIIKTDKNHPIIIEGIHGLNPLMTSAIPEKNKVKIYISALTQLNIDDHNRLAATDIRFLRRMVRDFQFRSSDPLKTFEMWEKVRAAEDTKIFPFQEEADISLDTSLAYELFVLKPFAKKLLNSIKKDSIYYKDAKRLSEIFDYMLTIDQSLVPDTSLLREFIGNSFFEDDGPWN